MADAETNLSNNAFDPAVDEHVNAFGLAVERALAVPISAEIPVLGVVAELLDKISDNLPDEA